MSNKLLRDSAALRSAEDLIRSDIAEVMAGAADRGTLATVERRERLVRADYLRQLEAEHADAAEVAAEALADLAGEREQVEHRVSEQEAALEALAGDPPADGLLDLANDLRAAVRGLDAGQTVREVNERLREAIDWVEFQPAADGSLRVRAYMREAFYNAKLEPEAWAVADFTVDAQGRPRSHRGAPGEYGAVHLRQ